MTNYTASPILPKGRGDADVEKHLIIPRARHFNCLIRQADPMLISVGDIILIPLPVDIVRTYIIINYFVAIKETEKHAIPRVN